MNHRDLCKVALRWLKRPNGAGGHGCQVALSECRTGWDGEIPDAIGFRATGFEPKDGSVVVEVKVSRSDFLADAVKPHRKFNGVGRWRYYMAPKGLILPEELPEKWGLLEVSPGGRISIAAGPAAHAKRGDFLSALQDYSHDRDLEREMYLLVKTLSTTSDPQKVLDMLRDANNRNARLVRSNDELRREIERYRIRAYDPTEQTPLVPTPALYRQTNKDA